MKCRYDKEIFSNPETGYRVYQYLTREPIPSGAKSRYYKGPDSAFSAFGYHLPDKEMEVDLTGDWVKGKYGLQFAVEYYEEVIPETAEGIHQYLSSGIIKGIGPRTADAIVDRFGGRTFEVFDKEPERLLSIRGISEKKLSVILASYQETNSRRELTMLLAPFQLGTRKIAAIQEAYGDRSLQVIRESTYDLCSLKGFTFAEVDKIARANHIGPDDPERIRRCLDYVMALNMKAGNLFLEKEAFIRRAYRTLNQEFHREAVSRQQICAAANGMVLRKELIVDGSAVYTKTAYEQEEETAYAIAELLLQEPDDNDIRLLLKEAQKELGIRLSKRQEEAVRMVFRYRFSIITGGPGTGKTTVEKVILYIYEKLEDGTVLLMAPTGRASRRMAESTGFMEASTMHSALGILSDDDDFYDESEPLEAELLMSDEFSMVDMRLAHNFFCRIEKNTRLVLVGDVNQLPSVGPGNVFRELIESGVVPITVLDVVFRQGKNSQIIYNADLMQKDRTDFLDGEDFILIPADTEEEARKLIYENYLKEVKENGIENVQILTPMRKGDGVSVNGMNEELHEMMNPSVRGRLEMKAAGRTFRAGDKVMQIRNKDGISNGDSGFVKAVYLDSDGVETAQIAFGDRLVEYDKEQLEMMEHAYAQTVHKSQGSEYPVVILPWLPAFANMLKRNILYTAVTRAKVKLILIGRKESIEKAVHNHDSDKRNTCLGKRLVDFYYKLLRERGPDEPVYEQMAINL
ncbi:MAG: ATP-dependent RecD-like DNA helicase [Alitiscatomonas sp.]